MDEIDGDGATRFLVLVRRQCCGDLDKPSAPHKIGLKRRAHGISTPRGTRNQTTLFPADGVIHRHDERLLGVKELDGLATNHIKKTAWIDPVLREETVVRRPVVKLPARGRDQTGHGPT